MIAAFGEALIRYAPENSSCTGAGTPSCAALFLRNVAGSELNTLVALRHLGRDARFLTVLPAPGHPLGDLVRQCASDAGVELHATDAPAASEVGSFTVLPHKSAVHYRRKTSAFWSEQPEDWRGSALGAALQGCAWLHATGITAQCGGAARANWEQHLAHACELGKPAYSQSVAHFSNYSRG